MKSRITVEVDFSNGNLPIIQILSRSSDDVRDNLIKNFLQNLDHTSRWCRIEYIDHHRVDDGTGDHAHQWNVRPIRASEIPEEIKLMKTVLPAELHEWNNVYGNSTAFRDFLTSLNISWKPNEHYTLIEAKVDLFELGQKFQRYSDENKK